MEDGLFLFGERLLAAGWLFGVVLGTLFALEVEAFACSDKKDKVKLIINLERVDQLKEFIHV